MSSKAISGRPGGGKSYYAVKLVLRALERTDGPVVTNLPLRLENIVKYFLKRGMDVAVYDRVQILNDDQVPEFWRYRGNGIEPLPRVTNDDYKRGVRPDFDSVQPGGVTYFIDECHDFLNSRNWQTTGAAVLYYISKHRHLGDDVYWITQSIKNVDSQFRSVTQDYTYCRNYAKEKFRGFTKGKYFTATTYLEPVGAGPNKPDPQESEKYKMERDIGACYYTSKQKLAADTGEVQRGLSIKWVFGGLIALVVLVSLVLWLGPKLAVEHFTKPIREKEQRKQELRDKLISGDAGKVGNASKNADINAGAPLTTPDLALPVHVVGVPLRFSPASAVLEKLGPDRNSLLPQGTISPSPDGSALVISGTDLQRVLSVAEVLRQLDLRCAVVTIHCVVGRRVKASANDVGLFTWLENIAQADSSRVGDLLSSLAFDLQTGLATVGGAWTAREALSAFSQFVSSDSLFDVLSSPTLTTLAGQTALFSSGREIPVPETTVNLGTSQTSVSFKRAEFSLKVTPTIDASGAVRCVVEQENSDVLSEVRIEGNNIPTLSTQKLQTVITLGKKQVAFVGGIKIRTAKDGNRGTPYLRRIPILGMVFGRQSSSEEESELFVMLAAEISRPGEVPDRAEPARVVTPRRSPVADTSTLSAVAPVGSGNKPVNKGPKNQKQEKSKK